MARGLLPIGSVVKLQGADKLMMICGFCPTGPAKPGYVYDYSGFPYPEGYMDVLKIYQFDNEQIERVEAIGYQDREAFAYVDALQNKVEDIKANAAASAADRPKSEPVEEEAETDASNIPETINDSDFIE